MHGHRADRRSFRAFWDRVPERPSPNPASLEAKTPVSGRGTDKQI
jgi:hypothetical protein